MSDAVDDQLDALWTEIRGLRAGRSLDERQGMLDRLAGGPRPDRVSAAGIEYPAIGVNPAAAYQGNAQPFIGQANVLVDPTFDGDGSLGSAFIAGGTAFGEWTAAYVLNSGAAVVPTISFIARGTPNSNPFSSGQVQFAPTTAGVSDLTIYLYPTTPFHPNYVDSLDYLVAAMRVHYPFGFADATHYTTITATLEIYDGTGAVVVASSIDHDLLTTSPSLITAAYSSTNSVFRSKDWYLRLKLRVVTTGAYTFLRHIQFGEPQMHFAYTPDPLPYQPAIANWAVAPILAGDAAGGDLSGTYPNPSVVNDSHGHTEATLALSDVATDDVSTAKHGFVPKAPNDTTKYLRGDGTWAVPPAGGSIDVQAFTASGTWTKPSGAKVVHVWCLGPGGGGGSGRKGAAGSARFGGGGGAGGASARRDMGADWLGATETVTVGTGGAGGAAQSTNSTNGSAGSAGSADTTFGSWVRGRAGVGGDAGSNAAGGGATSTTPTVDTVAALNDGEHVASGGSGGSSSTSATAGAGSNSFIYNAGGGGGGGIDAGNTNRAGGNGGVPTAATAEGMATPAGGTAGATGVAGGNGATLATNALTGTGGGGGGARGAQGGDGGRGCGGGGGAAGTDAAINSGKGGAGGNGFCLVVTVCG